MNIDELKNKVREYKTIVSEKQALKVVKQDGDALRFVSNQTDEICLQAVKQNGFALRFVSNQTDEICLEAVKQNGNVLQYVKIFNFENEAQEMTIADIENKLGYKIKIKGETNECK